jgi:hypothetical protein
MGKPKTKGETKPIKMRLLTLKIREDLHRDWKIQAAQEGTTMSKILERLVESYLKRKGVK